MVYITAVDMLQAEKKTYSLGTKTIYFFHFVFNIATENGLNDFWPDIQNKIKGLP